MGIERRMKNRVQWARGGQGFSFTSATGRFSLSSSLLPSLPVSGARCGAAVAGEGGRIHCLWLGRDTPGDVRIEEEDLDDAHGRGVLARFEDRAARVPGGGELSLLLEVKLFDARPFVLLRTGVRNTGRAAVAVRELLPLAVDGDAGSWPGEAAADSGILEVGWHDWVFSGYRRSRQAEVRSLLSHWSRPMSFNPAAPRAAGRGDFWSSQFAVVRRENAALAAGFVTAADQFGLVHARFGRAPALGLVAQADDVPVLPGQEMWSEWGFVQLLALPSPDPLADYVDAVRRQMRPRVPQEARAAQWSSWYQYFSTVTAGLFLSNLDAVDAVRDAVPYGTVQLDDGYQPAWGDWGLHNAKFPEGLGPVARAVRDRGYEPGLWLAPFVVDPRSLAAARHPEWLRRDSRGRPLRAGFFGSFFGHALDPSNPAVIDQLRETVARAAREWGFGFIKADFLYAGALPGPRHDASLTRAQAFRRALEAIREGAGEDTFLLGCGCPFGPAIGVVDAMRIGPDTAPCWTPYLQDVPWATPLLRRERSIPSLRNALRHALVLSPVHRRWWWNDPDSLMVRDFDTRLTDDEVRASVAVMGLSGGLLTHSDDLGRLGPDRISLLALCSPVLSPGGRALDLLEREMPRIYDVELGPRGTGQRAHVTALFNWGSAPASVSIDPEHLGWAEGQRLHVFELWTREYRTHEGGVLSFEGVPSHGCRVCRTCPADGGPALVGSTLHVLLGAEIESVGHAGDTFTLAVRDLARRARGTLYAALPSSPREVLVDGKPAEARRASEGVYALPCDLRGRVMIEIRL
jgi:alpha-galactosidase